MYRPIIYTLTVIYQHLAVVGRALKRDQIANLSQTAKTLSDTAPMAVVDLPQDDPGAAEQLERARLIEEHIEEMKEYLLRQEII